MRRVLESPNSETSPRPFLKWAGGKRRLLAQIEPFLPDEFGTFHEPFMGSAALFFHLVHAYPVAPKQTYPARLSDTNQRLVRTYLAVRDRVEDVLGLLATYRHTEAFFRRLRARDIDKESDVEVAAWLIYLNRTAYNGLYRVNSKNRFNVPFGSYVRPNFHNPELLRAASRALAGVSIEHASFEAVRAHARRGDLVYFDPPYVPLNATSYFTAYTFDGFGPADHERLRDVARELKGRGVHVLLSNSSAPAVRALYRDGFELATLTARREVSCKPEGRGPIAELLIR